MGVDPTSLAQPAKARVAVDERTVGGPVEYLERLIAQSRDIVRPDDDVMAEIRKLDVSVLYDGLRNIYPYSLCDNIRGMLPFMRGRVFAGPAVTIEWRQVEPSFLAPKDPRSDWGRTREDHTFAAIDLGKPGDVIVEAGGGHALCFVGELLGTFAKRRGIEAWVIDGMARDVAHLERMQMPIFARGTAARSEIQYLESVNMNVPVQLDRVRVNPGDVVLGDDDGVLVIPKELIPSALEGARQKREFEKRKLAEAEQGKPFLLGELGRLVEQYRREGKVD